MNAEPERRLEKRIQLAEPIIARFGSSAVVVIDLSPRGARIEHYSRLDRGTERALRLQWNNDDVGVRATVVRARIERFIPGEHGVTVYRSGLAFAGSESEAVERLRKIVSDVVAATLVEQVANARGFQTKALEEMPIFRNGILTTNDPRVEETLKKLLPQNDLVNNTGYVRLTLLGDRWKQQWTLDPTQPEREGFTISASEAITEIKLLCSAYAQGTREGRQLIRKFAEVSIEKRQRAN